MATKTEVKGSRQLEAWYEYTSGVKETLKTGMRRIDDPDDPRWEDELQKPPFKAGARGYVLCGWTTRMDGKIVQFEQIIGDPCHQNKAREFLRNFKRLMKEGSDTPWDHDRHYRTMKEEAARREREEARQTAATLRSLLVAAAEAGDNA